MRNNSSSCRKYLKDISTRVKVMSKFSIALLVMIMVVVYLPKVFAAPLLQRMTVVETPTDIQTEIGVQDLDAVNNPDDAANSDTQIKPDSQVGETVSGEEANAAVKDEENLHSEGVDLKDNPDYIAELKKIYSEEDLKRLYAPRQWVIMPNVVGMTEAEALSTLRARGLVGRVIYEDKGKKEGACFLQDIPAGTKWNTDASIFLWVQRKEDATNGPPYIEEITPQMGETSEHIEPVESANGSSDAAEPGDTNLSQPMQDNPHPINN